MKEPFTDFRKSCTQTAVPPPAYGEFVRLETPQTTVWKTVSVPHSTCPVFSSGMLLDQGRMMQLNLGTQDQCDKILFTDEAFYSKDCFTNQWNSQLCFPTEENPHPIRERKFKNCFSVNI